jgi:RNA polymerase sigma factor (sigma-70 family)
MSRRNRIGDAGRWSSDSMIGLSDDEVFVLFRETRQQSYFEEIDRRYRAKLVALAATMTDHHSAEDIASQVLVAAFLKCDSFDVNKGNLQSWLYQIARNEATKTFRANIAKKRGGGFRRRPLDDAALMITPPALTDAAREQLMVLVWSLDDTDRQLVFGILWDGLSEIAVAAKLSTTRHQVRKRLAAVLQRLQPKLDDLDVA